MNPGDGVIQNSDGSWTATVNGQQVYTGPDGQQAQNAFISNQPGGSNTSDPTQNYGFTSPTDGTTAPSEGYNAQYYSQAEQAIQDSINNAYREQYLNAIDIPGLNLKANDLALQAAQQRAQDLMQYASANGDLALKSFAQVASTGVDIANLLTKMQGPSNAFAYDRAMNYLGNSGLGGSVGAVTGAARPAQFGLMGPTQPWDFSTMNQQLGNTQQGPNIIDSLLGLGNQAWTQYGNATNGQLPFSIPQFNTNQNQLGAPTTPPSTQPAPAPAPSVAPTAPPTAPPTTPPTTPPSTPPGDNNNPIGTFAPQVQTQQNTLQNQSQLNSGPSYAAPSTPSSNTTNNPTSPGFGIPSAPSTNTTNAPTTNPLNPASWTQNMLGAMGINSSNTPGSWNNATYPGYSVAASQYLYGLPDPSQMNATNFFQLPKYSQDLMLSGYAAKGYDPSQLTELWQNQLPGKAAGPAFGLSS